VNDDDIGRELRALADTAAQRCVRPPAATLRRRLARRRMTVGTSLAVVTSLALVTTVAALDREPDLPPVTPVPSTSPTATPSASASPAPPAAPVTIVAGRDGSGWESGPIALLSARTGRIGRTLPVNAGEGPITPTVSYDRRTAYFSRVATSCTNDIVAAPLRGGPERVLATTTGYEFAVSRDDRWLAYETYANGCDGPTLLVVKDLRLGTERRWRADAKAGVGDIGAMAWAPDSRRLAVVRQLPGRPQDVKPGSSGGVRRELYLLDTRAPGVAITAGRKVPGAPRDGYVVDHPIFRGPQGALVVVERCCHLDTPSRMVQIDPQTGRRTLLVKFEHDVIEVDYDSSGRYLLHVDGRGRLYRWDDGLPVYLADGITSADW
jgi:hypothetical protein